MSSSDWYPEPRDDRPGAADRASDPYGAQAPYGPQDPYGSQDPYGAQDPYGSRDPYGSASPYGAGDPSGPAPGVPASSAPAPVGGRPGVAGGPPIYYVAPLPTPGFIIAGFVLGIVSITFCAGLTAPFGLYYSIRGMRAAAPGAEPPVGGYGLAIAGLVTSILGMVALLFMLAYFVLIAVLALSAPSGY